MLESQDLLKQTTIADVVYQLGLPFKIQDGSYQQCIFCQSDNSLKINRTSYRCANPRCSKHGNLYQFLVDIGICSTYKDAIKKVRSLLGIPDNHDFQRRYDLLEEVFEIYCRQQNEEAEKYLEQRGLSGLYYSHPYGYAPDFPILEERGVNRADLIRAGLLNTMGYEFFRNRVIYPIRNANQRIVHLQGRSLDPGATVRWLSTPSIVEGDMRAASINRYFYNVQSIYNSSSPAVILAEGITDTLSVSKLGLPAIGCFGVQSDLTYLIDGLKNKKSLFCVFDNDRYGNGTEHSGKYKSWSEVLPNLIKLHENLPELKIYCILIPPKQGKDMNDWLINGLTKSLFLQYMRDNGLTLASFCIDLASKNLLPMALAFKASKIHRIPTEIEQLNFFLGDQSVEFIFDNF